MEQQNRPDPVLSKSLRLLVHPLTLLALALLLVNDHVLRRVWPSALTGKLGDFAWLFFIPLVLLTVLALLAPGRARWRTRALPLLAYTSVALLFALAKTLPSVHAWVVSVAGNLFGFEVGWRRDPSDLVALTAVGLSSWLWLRTREMERREARPAPAGWIALLAAALLTVANSPAPDPGVYCLDERAGELEAYAGYSVYRSTDGGLTWVSLPNRRPDACPNPWSDVAETTMTVADPNNSQRQFRVTPGHSIELSEDDGATWRAIYTAPALNEATLAATRKRLATYAMLRPVPLDARVDRATGNAVFAMGHAGVLVYAPASAAWQEIAVGGYQPAGVYGPGDYLELLIGEGLLGLAIALLAFATLGTRLLVRGRALWVAALVVGWLIWAGIVFLLQPALAYSYGAALTYIALLALGVILLVLTAISIVGSVQHGKGTTGKAVLTSLAAGLLFLLPYALWAGGAIPSYVMAAIFGALLGVAAVIAGARWIAPVQERVR